MKTAPRITAALLLAVVAVGAAACNWFKGNSPTDPSAPDVTTWLVAGKTENNVTHAAVSGVLLYARSQDNYESKRATTDSDGWIPSQPMQSRYEPLSLYWIAQPAFGSNYVRMASLLTTTKQKDPQTGGPRYVSILGLSEANAVNLEERVRAAHGCRMWELIVPERNKQRDYPNRPPCPSTDGFDLAH